MIRLRLLGTVDLRDSQGRELGSVLRRPKLLALLGYLTVARPRGLQRRDTLVALLWPELDHAHARNALSQAVHALRQALGHAALLARGERSEEHTSELQSRPHIVCRLLLAKKKTRPERQSACGSARTLSASN